MQDELGRSRTDRGKDQASAHVDTMLFFGMINWTYTWYKADGAIKSDELADRCVELFLEGFKNAKS